jgi:hypothetical protein
VIDAERHLPLLDVAPKQSAALEDIEEHYPTRDFRVAVAPGMVLPRVAVLVRDIGGFDATSNDPLSEHSMVVGLKSKVKER